MASIGEIIFCKSVVLTGWATFQEARKERWDKMAWDALVVRFQAEWDRRRAEQPLQLTHRPLRLDPLDGTGTLKE